MNHQCIRQHLKQQAYRIATSGASRAIPVIIRDLRQMQAGTARLVGPEHHNGTRPQAPERNHQTPDRREASIEVGQVMTLGLGWPTCTFNHPREGGGHFRRQTRPQKRNRQEASVQLEGGVTSALPKASHTPPRVVGQSWIQEKGPQLQTKMAKDLAPGPFCGLLPTAPSGREV